MNLTMTEDFVAYVGDADLHDGVVLRATESGDRVTAVVKGFTGREWVVEFYGVASVRGKSESGMRIYAVAEVRDSHPLRRIVFKLG